MSIESFPIIIIIIYSNLPEEEPPKEYEVMSPLASEQDPAEEDTSEDSGAHAEEGFRSKPGWISGSPLAFEGDVSKDDSQVPTPSNTIEQETAPPSPIRPFYHRARVIHTTRKRTELPRNRDRVIFVEDEQNLSDQALNIMQVRVFESEDRATFADQRAATAEQRATSAK
ncbi:hypothetical protein L1987_13408 [Smallanthus sonchifolius]|uniref:Uncharacterized protein n=1 Tax=Smallanthus sonchifolius TaxID=185202 RepID=A0ACB9JJX9_9ASTR|nr:hypothetical protein L1987_13408 [Smallanthus sonchifolius]